jgi:hypothetical protein
MGIISEMRKKVCLGFALFSAELKQSRICRQAAKSGPSRRQKLSLEPDVHVAVLSDLGKQPGGQDVVESG